MTDLESALFELAEALQSQFKANQELPQVLMCRFGLHPKV
jgi:hypothetical protein